jgi:hypothetical protein
MLSPEQVAKFSVYDGMMWHTVTGNATVNGWTHVAAVVNGSNVSLYVNGTLEITIWKYSMVDREIQEEFESILDQYTNSTTSITTFTLRDGVNSVDSLTSAGNTTGKPEVPYEENEETLTFKDNVTLKINGTSLEYPSDSLKISEDITLLLNNQTVYYSGITNHTVSLFENFTLSDTLIQQLPINSTVLSEGLRLQEDILLKLNDTFFLHLPENLYLTEEDTLFLNNETAPEFDTTNNTSSLIHSEIEIGKPVTWTQTVVLNETDDIQNILLELPSDAQNITVAKIDSNSTEIIPDNSTEIVLPETEPVRNEFDIPRVREMSLKTIAQKHNVTHIVPLDYAKLKDLKEIKQKDKPTVALLINETSNKLNNATLKKITQNQTEIEYKVQFETSSPYALEQDYSIHDKFQKNVTVAHDSTLHYTNVRSYSSIPEYLVNHNVEFKLNWMINNTKVDVTNDPRFDVSFVDTDGNGIADRMTWIVPQLSEQEFEIEADIEIINVQSYPVVGGNWTVYFTTTGTADLTITGINGTTFGTDLPDDLEFLELNNGTHTLTPTINLTANTITYYNYSSNLTGFEASKVLTPGKHHLMFQFGNDVGFANNLADFGTNNIRQIIKCSGTNMGGADSVSVDLTGAACGSANALADLTKAFVFMSFNFGVGGQHSDTFRAWNLTSTTNLEVWSEQGDASPVDVDWNAVIVEFGGNSTIAVQEEVRSIGANYLPEGEVSTSLGTAITPAESMLIHSGHHHDTGETTIGAEELERVRIIDANNWGWQVDDTPNSGPQVVHAQIIDWNDPQVFAQRGQATMTSAQTQYIVSSSAARSTSGASDYTAIDETRTLLFVSYYLDGTNYRRMPDSGTISATLDANGDIVIDRYTAQDNLNFNWELVEFPANFLSTEHGTISQAGGTSSSTAAVADVGEIENAFAIGTVTTPFGLGGGRANGGTVSQDSNNFGNSTFTIDLETTTSVRAIRGDNDHAAVVGFQVINFGPALFTDTSAGSGLNTNVLHSMVFADFDYDGYVDMAKSSTASGGARTISTNDQDGTFTTSTTDLTVGYRGLGWGDAYNDGDIDLVGRDPNVLRNNGDGTWTQVNPAGNNGEAAMWVDIDADGDLDIWEPGQTYLWYEQTGAGTFTGRTGLPDGDGNNDVGNPTDGSGAGEGASVADVNNDGYLDLIYANQGTTNPLYEIFTGGPGTSTNRAYSIGEDPVGAITIVDTEHAITSDSGTTLDITGVTVAGGDRYLLVGVGFNDDFDQTISSVVLDPGGGSQTSLAAIAGSNAQVQDDGHTELWGVANPPTGIFTVRVTISGALTGGEALGAGAWSLAGVDQTTPLGAAATTVGDPADPLTITIASAVDDIAFAVGFVEDRTFDGINSGIQDWDNDASGDAQAGGHIAGAAGNVIIEWDISGSDKTVGSGVSVKPATGGITGLPVRVNEHEDMEWAWGDFDNDGDLDVLISGNDGEGLYENDGTGGFTDVTSAKGLSISATSGADWGDYDNDGDLDLIIANGANSILYTNNGAATYDFHATPLNGLLDITNVVGWIDYDNDGDMDIMGGEGELYRNELYDHTDLPNNPNRYLRVLPMGNATNASPDHGSPLTPIGAQIQIKNSADMSLVASSEIFAGYNNFQPPNYRHFGDIDPNAQYNVEVLFPSQTNTTILWVTPSELWNHRYNVTYSNGNYQLPQAINVTETSGNLMKYFDPMRDQVTVQDTLTFTLTRFVEDATTVDDDIVIVMRMLDETATIEDIIVKDPAAMRPQDSATVSDSLAYSLTRGTSDSVTIDDNIVIVMRMLDETATVEDIIVKDPAALRPQDSATVQDTLRYTLTRPIADAITNH